MLRSRRARSFSLILSTLFLCTRGISQPKTEKSLTVCEVLSNLSAYHGKTITVRDFFSWTRHGWTLSATPDFQPCAAAQKLDHAAVSGIYLLVMESERERLTASLQEARQKVNESYHSHGPMLTIVATFTGKLEAKAAMYIHRLPSGSYQGEGYGRDGLYPASMLCESVKDVKLVTSK